MSVRRYCCESGLSQKSTIVVIVLRRAQMIHPIDRFAPSRRMDGFLKVEARTLGVISFGVARCDGSVRKNNSVQQPMMNIISKSVHVEEYSRKIGS